MEFPKDRQGSAKPVTSYDMQQDAHGLTNPNLHRRVDAKMPSQDSEEMEPRDYKFTISSKHSYRTTTIHTHDEDSTESEVP